MSEESNPIANRHKQTYCRAYTLSLSLTFSPLLFSIRPFFPFLLNKQFGAFHLHCIQRIAIEHPGACGLSLMLLVHGKTNF